MAIQKPAIDTITNRPVNNLPHRDPRSQEGPLDSCSPRFPAHAGNSEKALEFRMETRKNRRGSPRLLLAFAKGTDANSMVVNGPSPRVVSERQTRVDRAISEFDILPGSGRKILAEASEINEVPARE